MGEAVRPVRLRLSRAKGFDLQRLSRETNGLEAVKVSRPGRFGNYAAVRSGFVNGQHAVDAFQAWVDGEASQAWKDRVPLDLRGKNLACWCRLDQPCHAEVLLDLANRPVCDAPEGSAAA